MSRKRVPLSLEGRGWAISPKFHYTLMPSFQIPRLPFTAMPDTLSSILSPLMLSAKFGKWNES